MPLRNERERKKHIDCCCSNTTEPASHCLTSIPTLHVVLNISPIVSPCCCDFECEPFRLSRRPTSHMPNRQLYGLIHQNAESQMQSEQSKAKSLSIYDNATVSPSFCRTKNGLWSPLDTHHCMVKQNICKGKEFVRIGRAVTVGLQLYF